MSKNQTPKIVGDICLYGNGQVGAGYLVSIPTPAGAVRVGTGDPVKGRSMTDALWHGLDQVNRILGGGPGIVRVFGTHDQMALVDVRKLWPYYGELVWGPAPVYVLSVEEIERAAAAGDMDTLAKASDHQAEPYRFGGPNFDQASTPDGV